LVLSNESSLSIASRFGFQSGGFAAYQTTDIDDLTPTDDNSYASSIYYDRESKLAYVTGSTYSRFWDSLQQGNPQDNQNTHIGKSDCFLAVLKIPYSSNDDAELNMELLHTNRYGKTDIDEACSSLSVVPDGKDKARVVAMGHTEHGGFLTSLRPFGSSTSTVYGFLLDMNFDLSSSKNGSIESITGNVSGGTLLNYLPVQYPVEVTSNPKPVQNDDKNALYVASLSSYTTKVNDQNPLLQDDHPDITTGGGLDYPYYGSDFKVSLHKMIPKTQEQMNAELEWANLVNSVMPDANAEEFLESITEGWTKIYGPQKPTEGELMLQVADLVYVPNKYEGNRIDFLLMVGSTNGAGDAFGGDSSGVSPHGFITKIDPMTGDVAAPLNDDFTATLSIGQNTKIKGICFDRENDDVDVFYVVGVTNDLLDENISEDGISKTVDGSISAHAFMAKINLDTLEIIWVRQFGAVNGNDVTGFGCDVPTSGDYVFMGGTVLNSDVIRLANKDDAQNGYQGGLETAGNDDIFVGSFSATDGSLIFMRQIGTSQDDSLAKANGISCDENGNAIIFGNSRGSMMRWRGYTTTDSIEIAASDVFIASIGKSQGAMRSTAESLKRDVVNPKPEQPSYSRSKIGFFEVFALLVGSMAVVLYGSSAYIKFKRENGSGDMNERVVEYLERFDDDSTEIHIRHSATGGIHGVYDFSKKKSSSLLPSETSFDNRSMSSSSLHQRNSLRFPRNSEMSRTSEFEREGTRIGLGSFSRSSWEREGDIRPPKLAFASSNIGSLSDVQLDDDDSHSHII
jgi:hypothetical protein